MYVELPSKGYHYNKLVTSELQCDRSAFGVTSGKQPDTAGGRLDHRNAEIL